MRTRADAQNDPARARVLIVPVANLTTADKTAIIRLCSEAHGVDFGRLFEFLSDPNHVLAYLGDELVGHACWTTRRLRPGGLPPLRTAWVDAVSTAPAHQNRGIGSLVMQRLAAETAAFELGALGTDRLTFYERLGWAAWRGSTEDVLHDPLDTLMVLRTATTPPLDLTAPITAS